MHLPGTGKSNQIILHITIWRHKILYFGPSDQLLLGNKAKFMFLVRISNISIAQYILTPDVTMSESDLNLPVS